MNENSIMEYLNIEYLKLHFTAEMLEDCILPKSKASALRGGMGQRMLDSNCVLPTAGRKDEDCKNCNCRSECLVQRFLYTPMEIPTIFSSDQASMGYLFECEDYHEEFRTGDRFEFSVILFGKSRVYVNLLLQSLWALGQTGLGKNGGRFYLAGITNSRKQSIFAEAENSSQIIKSRLQPETIAEYVAYRKRQIMSDLPADSLRIEFKTEAALKYEKQVVEEFSMEAIVSNLVRRVYMFNCFAGYEMDYYRFQQDMMSDLPAITDMEVKKYYGKRYSTRKQSAMPLNGIGGYLEIEIPDDELLELLLAGEVMHVGRNTTFGFGRYRVSVR